MIKIVDTYAQIGGLFENGIFQYDRWEAYMNSIFENSAHILKDDVDEYSRNGNCVFERDIQPILEAVCGNPELDVLHEAFLAVTDGLGEKIKEKFGREPDTEVVLYLGLCNAAGWVTEINGKDVVLLGVEKIIELDWCDVDCLYGLIYHELGHIYQKQYGNLKQKSADAKKNFVFQLFTEGIAMYFEQVLLEDFEYFHQDKNGWKAWCDEHLNEIAEAFHNDLPTMTRISQRYFGDWVFYEGHCDTGYYLGTRFVQQLLKEYGYEDLICLDIDKVYELYERYQRLVLM